MSVKSVIAASAAIGFVLSFTGAMAADDVKELRARIEEMSRKLEGLEAAQQRAAATAAQAQAPAPAGKYVETGSFPGSFLVPGTNTSIKVGGLAKLDGIYDFTGAGGDSAAPPAVPITGSAAANRKRQARLHARQSQIKIEARTPTDYGNLRGYVEADFFGAGGDELLTNSTGFRVRHAFLEFGPVLAGQTWTNFFDTAAQPETIDFNGPSGTAPLRQAQLRYSYVTGPHTLAVALENPQGDFTARDGTSNANALDRWPDLTARWSYAGSWGHVALRGMARSIRTDAGRPGQRAEDFGYGLGLSGSVVSVGKDKLLYQLNGGRGIGRYIQDAVGLGAAYNGGADLDAQTAYGGTLAYQHWWLDGLRSTAAYGHTRMQNGSILPRTVTKSLDSLHANLIWSPVPAANVGLEYIYERRELESGASGKVNRLQIGLSYGF